jgi:hypothetical protein
MNDCALRPAVSIQDEPRDAVCDALDVDAAYITACNSCHSSLFHLARTSLGLPLRIFCADCLTEITS